MKKILAISLIAALATGCANMTPEQNAALGAGLVGAAAVAGAVANARQPVYVQPVYVRQPITVCNVYGRCWTRY
jgi:hypothetical protein